MKLSLVVTTYNWPLALDRLLASVARQVVAPLEVIVADDGSGPETAAVVEEWQERLTVPLIHLWQEDSGFRLARARNMGIAAAAGDYIAFVDGDMILDDWFVADHQACARPAAFIQGKRIRLSPVITAALLGAEPGKLNRWSTIRRYGGSAWRQPLLSRLRSRAALTLDHVQGCNQSFWREHLVRINGFDERFGKWGYEDLELAQRLLNSGIARYYVKHRALAFHLHHEVKQALPGNPNEIMFRETVSTRRQRCDVGLDSH